MDGQTNNTVQGKGGVRGWRRVLRSFKGCSFAASRKDSNFQFGRFIPSSLKYVDRIPENQCVGNFPNNGNLMMFKKKRSKQVRSPEAQENTECCLASVHKIRTG